MMNVPMNSQRVGQRSAGFALSCAKIFVVDWVALSWFCATFAAGWLATTLPPGLFPSGKVGYSL